MDEIQHQIVKQRQRELIQLAGPLRWRRDERGGRRDRGRGDGRAPGPRLPRELWIIQIGIFLNNLGYGAVLPFEIIYLHDGRGFSLGAAGLVVGALSGTAIVTA